MVASGREGPLRSGHRRGGRRRDLRPPVGEGLSDRIRQDSAVEFELPGKQPDVEKILHAAVQGPELAHRLEFLRDRALPTVTQKAGSGKVEKGRVIHLVWSRDDDIPEADVDLHCDPGIPKVSTEADAHPFVVDFHRDPPTNYGFYVEDQADPDR